jgi:hypothetical protein
MQVNQANYQAQKAHVATKNITQAPSSLDSFHKQSTTSTREIGYQRLSAAARFKRHESNQTESNQTRKFTDLDVIHSDLSVESTPQATLEKAQELQHQLLTNTDPTVYNPQLFLKAQLLERKAKAQLHKDQVTKRFVKAPRLL